MRITCVHQGFELYGSDRAFIETVRVIRGAWPEAEVDVILPRDGPIVSVLEGLASRIEIAPLWILRRRDLKRLATIGLLELPLAVGRALARIRRSDLVYVNTSVVADYLIAGRLCRGRSVVHVHEIPEGAVKRVLRALILWSGNAVIFNSRATERAFSMPSSLNARVVYNGIADPGFVKPMSYDGTRPLKILMLGRISRIKGQEVMVQALARLPTALRERIDLRIVGSAFEDAERERVLAEKIVHASLTDRVTLLPFTPDPSAHFLWADVVAVPSRLPESLGRVAIEAMAYGLPPIVSDIGGLPEVVEDGRTGWVVPPDDADALSRKVAEIATRPQDWAGFPQAARERYLAIFGEAASASGMTAVFRSVLSRRKPAGRSTLNLASGS